MSERIVVVGAGFGGLQVAKGLGHIDAEVTVIDRNNHHLFQPLLYQVATAGLASPDIAYPIRSILRRQKNTSVLMAEVTGIDRENKRILCSTGAVAFDYLVLATGSQYNYFGHESWTAFAPSLKSIPDAIGIRDRVLRSFEDAEAQTDPVEQRRLLTIVLVGAGPTGVELAGALSELTRRALAQDFRRIEPRAARIILVDGAPRILTAFPEGLSRKARARLELCGVEVRTGSPVSDIDAMGAQIGHEFIPAATVIWTAGVKASPVGKWLEMETDCQGRVRVEADLSVPGFPNIFLIGDAALTFGQDGKPLPGLAPVAMQQGRYVATLLARRIEGESPPAPFCYFDKGNLATIGRSSGIAVFKGLQLEGFTAWLLWLVVHLFYLIGFRNRVIVLTEWAWGYFTYQRGARVIPTSATQGFTQVRWPVRKTA